jgi:hypothetical protein
MGYGWEQKKNDQDAGWFKKYWFYFVAVLVVLLLVTNLNSGKRFGLAYAIQAYGPNVNAYPIVPVNNYELFSTVPLDDNNYHYSYLGILGFYLRTEARYTGPMRDPAWGDPYGYTQGANSVYDSQGMYQGKPNNITFLQ